MAQKRDELVARSLDYFLAHGVAGLSLRPLAAEVGTSARMLVYHFGSKEGLVTAVMDEVRSRVQRSFVEAVGNEGRTADRAMQSFWKWILAPRNLPLLRLLVEVQVLAAQDPGRYAHYLEGTSSSWLALIEEALPPSKDRRIIATLCAAVIDGLLLEVISTGDVRRTTKALKLFDDFLLARIRSASRPSRSARARRR